MREVVLGIGVGLLLAGVVLATAPWWVPTVGRLMDWWVEWVDRQIARIEDRRDQRRAR